MIGRALFTSAALGAAALTLAGCADDDRRVLPLQFQVRVENVSDASATPTALAPGVWVVTTDTAPLFDVGARDRGEGLEALAEDGDPSALATTLGLLPAARSGAFDTPVGAGAPGPIGPGEAYEFTVDAYEADGNLNLATMVVESNDLFLSPAAAAGVDLFVPSLASIGGTLDVSASFAVWDAGTEANQATAAGGDQAPRQASANTGAAEGVVAAFAGSTRALPPADRIVDVAVTEASGTYTVTVINHSATQGALTTPVAPLFWATHGAGWAFFTEGGAASAGLEELAEDGSPSGLIAAHQADTEVGTLGAETMTVEGTSGPAPSGERFRFSVTPVAASPYLSLAAMVVESNDAFLALPPGGVALLEAGNPRPAADVQADLSRLLAVWDAGTEANEAPGLGPNQPLRQGAPNTGPVDPDSTVRRHRDSTNDLATASPLVTVTIAAGAAAGSFDVTVTNSSGGSVYPTPFAPLGWALHTEGFEAFSLGTVAPTGLESLAEDGDPSAWSAWLAGRTEVGTSDIVNVPQGGGGAAPIQDTESYVFTVTPSTTHRFLSFASMVGQSNDAFVAFAPGGVALLDAAGAARSPSAIAADVAAALAVFDAGTEANQTGGAGPDQAPRQAAANTGAGSGSGTVRQFDDPVQSYPRADQMVRVTITRVR